MLRFNHHDVMTNARGIWDIIAAAVGEAVAPSLPCPRKRGRKRCAPPLAGEEKSALPRRRPAPGEGVVRRAEFF